MAQSLSLSDLICYFGKLGRVFHFYFTWHPILGELGFRFCLHLTCYYIFIVWGKFFILTLLDIESSWIWGSDFVVIKLHTIVLQFGVSLSYLHYLTSNFSSLGLSFCCNKTWYYIFVIWGTQHAQWTLNKIEKTFNGTFAGWKRGSEYIFFEILDLWLPEKTEIL